MPEISLSEIASLLGRKGGAARAKNLRKGKTERQLSEYMRRVANARWDKVRAAKAKAKGSAA